MASGILNLVEFTSDDDLWDHTDGHDVASKVGLEVNAAFSPSTCNRTLQNRL